MYTTLDVLSKTSEVQSGNWDEMKDLISDVQMNDENSLYWFSNLDGTYYTVEKGLTNANLKNRAYFSDLEEGNTVYGAVITGYTSLKKSAVAAIPVIKDEKTIGYIGGSKYVEAFETFLKRLDKSVYVITSKGETIFSYSTDEKIAETLNDCMLKNEESDNYHVYEVGTQKYLYVFGSSPSTGWLYAIGNLK
jgi:hypothetical protein